MQFDDEDSSDLTKPDISYHPSNYGVVKALMDLELKLDHWRKEFRSARKELAKVREPLLKRELVKLMLPARKAGDILHEYAGIVERSGA